MYYRLLSIVFVLLSFSSFSQLRLDTLGWRSPVDIPIYLSGNFAELRTGHLHAGIDIKTQGKEGFKLYAVQNGFVSRIKVASGGYGKAIYIDHPDGYTSVYAHLKEYNIQLDKYVKELQYKNENYEIDYFPNRGELPVNKGEIIGLSGNSGSSGGPHLHFEIRDTRNSHPLNGLFLGLDIKDNIAPRIDYLYVYPQNENSTVNGKNEHHYYSLKNLGNKFSIRQGDTLKVNGQVGFGLKVNDFLNGSANQCGVYELKAYLDGTLIFHEKFDGFSFAESRYINSLMDYKENVDKKRKLHKMFIEPNNRLSVYVDAMNRGVIDFSNETAIQKITVEAIDAYKNTSLLTFYAQYVKPQKILATSNSNRIVIPWQNEFKMDTMGLKLFFEKESFYDTLKMEFSIDTSRVASTFSAFYNIHNGKTAVHKYFELALKHDSIPDSLQQNLLFGIWNKDKFVSAGGLAKNGSVVGLVRELGTYTVLMDTIKPTIKPLGAISKSTDLTNSNSLQFIIDDDLSGIANYRGTINGNWVLYEYDAKNNLITYEFDEYMPTEGVFEVRIEVLDKKNNKTEFVKNCEIYPLRDNDIGQ
jgi:hypothetical protein